MDEISWIFGTIYLSSAEGAKIWERGDIIFVHHDIQYYTRGLHIPLLKKRPNDDIDRTGAEVNIENLKLIHAILDDAYNNDRNVLVHCRGGVERSPLVLATWLAGHQYWSLDRAYMYIQTKRPVVQDRRFWLREGATNYGE